MLPETIIFPRCGITYSDLIQTVEKSVTKKATAVKLGVSDTQLDRVIQKYSLEHLFAKQPGELFAGITAVDLLKAAHRCPNMGVAAKEFGISATYFTKKVKELGATEYFKREKPRKRRVSKRSILTLARQGYIRRDVAFLLGISVSYLKDLIKLWKLADEFKVSKGKAAWVTQKGYCN